MAHIMSKTYYIFLTKSQKKLMSLFAEATVRKITYNKSSPSLAGSRIAAKAEIPVRSAF